MKNLYLIGLLSILTTTIFAQTTIEVQVSSADDDLEEYIDGAGQTNEVGTLDSGSSDLELGSEDGTGGDPQLVGLRFQNVQVPVGARILSAYIQFGVDESKSTDDAAYTIRAQSDPNPDAFNADEKFNISSRSFFDMEVSWNVKGGTWVTAGDAGPDQRTSDLSALVQQIVNQADWQAGNTCVFTVQGTGTKVAESYDGDPALAPKLVVTFIQPSLAIAQVSAGEDDMEEYVDGAGQTNEVGSLDDGSSDLELGSESGDGGDPQLVGLRFAKVEVPAGAQIIGAFVQFTVDESKSTDPASYTIKAQADPNPDSFNAGENFNISSRATFDESVEWDVAADTWTIAGQSGPDQMTPNIASLIQQVVNQDGWEAGNAVVLTVEGTGTRVAESFDGDPAGAASLIVEYVETEMVMSQVSASDDDLEEYIDGAGQTNEVGTLDDASSDLELGSERGDGDDPQLVGIRFTNVDVAPGASIASAYIQFTVDESKSTEPASYTIRVQADPNPDTFNGGEKFNISSRETFGETVSWDVAADTWTVAGESGPDQRSPDVSSLIQAVVKQDGWEAGNAVVFTIEGTGTRVAESFDGDPAGAAKLIINVVKPKDDGGDTTVFADCNIPLPEGSKREVVLDVVSTYATGIFDEAAAEIVAYDAGSQRAFFTNADANSVTILNMSDPSNPTLIKDVSMDPFGGGVNSVATYDGLVAIAVEGESTQDSGVVVFADINGTALNTVTVGALPDMIMFSPDGTKVLTANEGEPNDDYTVDPEGSVSIIDISGGALNATVKHATFESYNDKKASLINRGVRIFGPGATVAQDLEPEYITMPNDMYAYVGLQEANALAVINVETATVMDIFALGAKNYNSGRPRLTEFYLNELIDLPELGTPAYDGGQPPVYLGGFSGLWFAESESGEDNYVFYAVPDRGPNDGAVSAANVNPAPPGNLRPFKLPDYQGQISKFSVNKDGSAQLLDRIYLTQKDGTTPITGRGNVEGFDEVPVTYADPATDYANVDYTDNNGEEYHALPYDPYGGDFEGILIDGNGDFWMCDEYRPAIYHFQANGQLIERYVPEGTSMLGTNPQPAGTYGAETLPAVYAKRRANRGFEAIAMDYDKGIVYAFIQSPIENPSSKVRNNSDVIRILGINPADGTPVSEYVYLLERNRDSGLAIGRVDKIGDAVYVGNGRFMILERDSSVPGQDEGKKYVFEINLTGATNILGTDLSNATEGFTLERLTADQLDSAGVQVVHKCKTLNLPSVGYLPSDKPEGIAMLPDGSIAVLNDNDFGLAGAGVSDNSSLGIIQFCDDNGIDASNEAADIEIMNWPVKSFYMPDALRSYTAGDKNYIVTVNEGDARDYDTYSEEDRVADLTLNPTYYPDAADLQLDENLGRLNITLENGDYDGDGEYEQIYGYGARSFSIWDMYGNLVYDSGNEFARIIADLDPDHFNSNNDDNDSRKSRSDDKGAEPEAVEIAQFGENTYALIGLERHGGIMVYNITDPQWPYYVTYINNRNWDVDATSPDAGDLGPEDIKFVPADQSPSGSPMILLASEVSGTMSVYGVEFDKRGFLVRIMHNNDGESKISQQEIDGRLIGGAAHFKTAVDSLRNEGTPNLMLSSGDNFLAGIAFNASLNLPPDRSFYDAVVIDSIEYNALCLGNHDFDFGPDILSRFIQDIKITRPPFLSSNLTYGQEPGLQALQNIGRIAYSTIVDIEDVRFGVIGLTTPALKTISSPRNVEINEDIAGAVMNEVALLKNQDINKIILISHLQSINEELELIGMLDDIDVVIAGGGDELLTNNEDNALPGISVFGEYPLKQADASGDTVYVITTPGEYRYVGNLMIEFNDDGTVFDVNEGSDVILIEGFAADPGLQASVVDSVVAYEESLDQNVIAITEVALDGTRESLRTKETNQGNLIADAFLWLGENERAASGLDPSVPLVAMQNSGGIRNNNIIPANSEITEKTTFDMLPFDNSMTYVGPLSVEDFVSALENSVAAIENVDGRFCQIAGFRIIYDMEGTPDEDRIYQVTLDDGTVIVDNYEISSSAPEAFYVITNNFTAGGGDAFEEFAAAGKINLGGSYQRTLFDYVVEGVGGVIAAADYPEGGEGRIREKSTVSTNFLNLGNVSFSASPNPFGDMLVIEYTLSERTDVQIQVIDMLGRTVQTVVTGIEQPGTQEYRLNTRALQSGTYTLIVRIGDQVGAHQVIKQ